MAEDHMRFEAEVRREHFGEIFRYSQKRLGRGRYSTGISVAFFFAAMALAIGLQKLTDEIAMPLDDAAQFGPREVVILAFVAGTVAAFTYLLVLSHVVARGYVASALRDGGSYLGSRVFKLDDEGVRIDGASGHTLTRWSAIMELTDTPHTLLLWTDPGAAIMVPKEAFADDAARDAFKALVMERIAAAKAE